MPTKLGPHVLRDAPDLADYIKAKPAVVKLVGDLGLVKTVPTGVLVVGRKHQGNYDAQLQMGVGKTPREAAEQFVQDQSHTYQANPDIKYWEGHNEPVWSSTEEMGWYAQFEVERIRLMADRGLKCVIGNFASGAPPLDLWPAFFPALQAAQEHQALLGLHEYSCPWMWWMTGAHQLDPTEDQGDEGWTTLRYRKVYRQHLIPNGLGNIPLVITECGIDPLVNPKPPGAGGGGTWRHLGHYWATRDNEPSKEDFYYRQLVWYDKELQKDDFVVGATLFTWGNFGPPWRDFDVADTAVAKKLIAYTERDPAQDFVPPETRPTRGVPRAQYKRVYVLLPPDAGADWAMAAVDAMWDDRRYTIGSSADDAGIGDLDERVVVAVNPSGWPTDLKRFFERYYPGVNYYAIEAGTPRALRAGLKRMPRFETTKAPEAPNRGNPRAQYARIYVLLPPEANREWAAAVVRATWEDRRLTIGSSADDAGIGDLDDRCVVAVNPVGWPADLHAFFERHYPGIEYKEVEAETAFGLKTRLAA